MDSGERCKQGRRQRGGQWWPASPFKIGAPPFHVWPTGCCIHPVLYFKNVPPPFWFSAPPSVFWPSLLLNSGDGPGCKSDVYVSYPCVLHLKSFVMVSLFHDSSPPSLHCDRTYSRYLERSCCRCPCCMPIVSWFCASGLCLWFCLGLFRNAWRLSLSGCQAPRKTKQWTWHPRIHHHQPSVCYTWGRDFFNVFLYYYIM